MAPLGRWVGYGVERSRHEDRSGRRWLVIALEPLPGVPRRCSGYGATIEAGHDRSQRRIRTLPVFDARWSCRYRACGWRARPAGRAWSIWTGWIPMSVGQFWIGRNTLREAGGRNRGHRAGCAFE